MTTTNSIKEHGKKALAAATAARRDQEFFRVHHLGAQGVSDPGLHYTNYCNMVSNRMLMLYDDCVLLLASGRTAATCVIARCILETYAIGRLSIKDVSKTLEKNGVDKAYETVLAYINSSRLKVEEQKRFKAGAFPPENYHLTPEALARMENEEAAAKHILNAMRNLFAEEMQIAGRDTSRFEMVYESLCEWTHPSQTSLFHAFAEETWMVPTSIGQVSIWDAALLSCAEAMHCIAGLPELRQDMTQLASALTLAASPTKK